MKVDWVRVYKTSDPGPTPSKERCGCNSCSVAWNTAVPAAEDPTATCGSRINWAMQNDGINEHEACAVVASDLPEKCPCDPSTCASIDKCGCDSCSEAWNTAVPTTDDPTATCGSRITYLVRDEGFNEPDACAKVASEFPQDCLCGASTCPSVHRCGCESCNGAWNTHVTKGDGNTGTCGSRIKWLVDKQSYSEEAACIRVATEFVDECRCDPFNC